MGAEVFIRPRAKQDIAEQAIHIAEDNPDASDRFLDALTEAFDALARMPEMGARREFDNPALEDIRMWPTRGFEKHLVFYRPIPNGIDVIRVLHAARDVGSVLNEASPP